MDEILDKLKGGDRRSIGRANEVVVDVLDDPSLFGAVFEGMLSDDPLVRMRAADAIEKITAKHPDYLQPYKEILIEQVARSEQQEVRWHVAQLFTHRPASPPKSTQFPFAFPICNSQSRACTPPSGEALHESPYQFQHGKIRNIKSTRN